MPASGRHAQQGTQGGGGNSVAPHLLQVQVRFLLPELRGELSRMVNGGWGNVANVGLLALVGRGGMGGLHGDDH